MVMGDPGGETGTSGLVSCPHCARRFNPTALERHSKICQKVTSKKRKVFDSSKQRVDGLEHVPKSEEPPPKPKKSNWKEKHEDFIQSIRAVKGDQPAPVRRVPSDYVQCPSCGRNFNSAAAARHIPWCKEQQEIRQAKEMNEAQNKLRARTKYKAPKPRRRTSRSADKSKPRTEELPPLSAQPPHSSPGLLENTSDYSRHFSRRSRGERTKAPPPLYVPIKFKEKFPNYLYQRVVDDDQELYNLTSPLSNQPRTVPGVRTGSQGQWVTAVNRSVNQAEDTHHGDLLMDFHKWSLPEVGSSESSPVHWLEGLSRSSSTSLLSEALGFCHHCGGRFPVLGAKFCCECGAPRRTMQKLQAATP